jgi:hypothetical protein
MNQFVGYSNIIPLLAPQDITTNITATHFMDLKHANRAAFLVLLGNVNSTTATDREEVTVEAVSAHTAAEAKVAFRYRISGALNANTWGAVTSVSATSAISLDPATHDNMLIWIEVDPEALGGNLRYVRLKFTDVDDMTNFLVGVVGYVDQKFRQATFASATAAATA